MPMVAVKQPYVLFVVTDDTPQNPRKEQDNLGTMICFHNRYSLGDEHSFHDPDDFLMDLLEEKLGDTEETEKKIEELTGGIDSTLYRNHYSSYRKAVHDNIIQYLSSDFLIEPIYLYDHSGITINTTGFSCPWDSGLIGWIYVSNNDIEKEYGVVTSETIEKAKQTLISEVKEFDYYLTDQCYGFKLFENNEEIASCWGFIGEIRDVQNAIKEHMPTECKNIVESLEYRYDDTDIEDILEEIKEQDEGMEV